MTLAREIITKLDQIIALKKELSQMKEEVSPDAVLTNKDTGDDMSLDDAVTITYGVLRKIKDDLNQITNDGQNVRNIFDNQFYINDMSQDKLIAEEIRLNKMEDCLAKQTNPENN